MDSALHTELLATCNALGYQDPEGRTYFKEPDCLEALKDLIRYLKHDDDTNEIRRWLGKSKILQTDLVPLLVAEWKDQTLFDVLVRLMVNLTTPALLLYREEIPEDKVTHNYYLELISHLQAYKECFSSEKVFAVLTAKTGEILKLDWEHRQEEDKLLIERILILIRNVLHVPANSEEEKRTDNDANVHDQILWMLHQSGMADILLYVASSDEENELCLHVLEIITLMFREQDAQRLARAGMSRTQTERQRDEMELIQIRQIEQQRKNGNVRKFLSARHSRFGGTYYVENMKSISDKAMICHQPLNQAVAMSFDRTKDPAKRPRNRRPMEETRLIRRSTLSIQMFLKEFCVEFLTNAYNPLMKVVKDSLMHQNANNHDETYYMSAMRFFMEFNRCWAFKVEYVGETMSMSSLHFVQGQIDNCLQCIAADKKRTSMWSRRLHHAVRAYRELLETLGTMDRSTDEGVKASARVIMGNVFYAPEYRELPMILIHHYDEIRLPKSYLKEIVELTHVFLKLIERFTSKSSRTLIVEKKQQKQARKKKKTKKESGLSQELLEEMWEGICDEVSATVQDNDLKTDADIGTFDANRKDAAITKIQVEMRNENIVKAVAMFRLARETWPDDIDFNLTDAPENEFGKLRKLFFAKNTATTEPKSSTEQQTETIWESISDEVSVTIRNRADLTTETSVFDPASELGMDDQKARAMVKIQDAMRDKNASEAVALFRNAREIWPEGDAFGKNDIELDDEIQALREICFANLAQFRPNNVNVDPNVEDDNDDEDEEEEVQRESRAETEFKLFDFVKTFASGRVVRPYTLLLNNFQHNDASTNHCIVKMLHRIAFDCKMPGLLYQASVFRTFQKILSNETHPSAKEIGTFARFVMKKFFAIATVNPKLFIEILFWKNTQEVYEIENGYGTYKEKSKASKQLWSEELENELEYLYDKFKDGDGASKDIVDLILDSLTDKTKTRRQVMFQLKRMGLWDGVAKRTSATTRVPREWQEDEVDELRRLYDENKESPDVLQSIWDGLTIKRPKVKITEKLLELGLVEDRKALHKKRARREKSGAEDVDDEKRKRKPRKRSQPNTKMTTTEPKNKVVDRIDVDTWNKISSSVTEKFRNALLWVKESLEQIAEDRDEDGDLEPVPIVPLNAECVNAMEDEDFMTFLRCLGIQSPANEQQSFWRVPEFVPSLIRKRVKFIDDIMEGKTIEADDSAEIDVAMEENNDSEIDSDDELAARDEPSKAKDSKRTSNSGSSDEDTISSSDDEPTKLKSKTVNKRTKPKIKKFVAMSSDESDDENTSKNKTRRKAIEIHSDDELLVSVKAKQNGTRNETEDGIRINDSSDDDLPIGLQMSKNTSADGLSNDSLTEKRKVNHKKAISEQHSESDVEQQNDNHVNWKRIQIIDSDDEHLSVKSKSKTRNTNVSIAINDSSDDELPLSLGIAKPAVDEIEQQNSNHTYQTKRRIVDSDDDEPIRAKSRRIVIDSDDDD